MTHTSKRIKQPMAMMLKEDGQRTGGNKGALGGECYGPLIMGWNGVV